MHNVGKHSHWLNDKECGVKFHKFNINYIFKYCANQQLTCSYFGIVVYLLNVVL